MRIVLRIILAVVALVLVLVLYKVITNLSQLEDERAFHAGLAKNIVLRSDAFAEGGKIPIEYTGKGAELSPQLSWDSVPGGTKSQAILVSDYDAPSPVFKLFRVTHWELYNIPHELHSLPKAVTREQLDSLHITIGKNIAGKDAYMGPAPPFGVHQYYFRIYALDFNSIFLKNDDRDELYKAMKGHVLGYGELVGEF